MNGKDSNIFDSDTDLQTEVSAMKEFDKSDIEAGLVSDLPEKTNVLFSMNDIQSKLNQGAEIDITDKDIEDESVQPPDLSSFFKTVFPEKSEADYLKLNRNFLKDAAPFNLKKLLNKISSAQGTYSCGFKSTDHFFDMMKGEVYAICSLPKHGKTVMMLNMIKNLASEYKDEHFIYYTYDEPRSNIELKLINLCLENYLPVADTSEPQRSKTNLQNLAHTMIRIFNQGRESECIKELKGYETFRELSSRIHIVSTDYNIHELKDSIKSFSKTFKLGGVFIDPVQKIRGNSKNLSREDIVNSSMELFSSMSAELNIFITVAFSLYRNENNIAEYDLLSLENFRGFEGIIQETSLILGLQNYAKSKYMGTGDKLKRFRSLFFKKDLESCSLMPDFFKTDNPYTSVLIKILNNRYGPEGYSEMILDRWLLKIRDPEQNLINTIKNY